MEVSYQYDKNNELEIITRDAGASGRHSHAGAWERESLCFYLKLFQIISHRSRITSVFASFFLNSIS